MFAIGVLPALVAFAIRHVLHEPEIFIQRHAARNENSFRLLVKDGRTIRISLGIAVLCSVQNVGYYSVMTWMPTYLAGSLGFTLTKSAMWTAVTVVGMVVGMWVFGQLADRIGRKPMFILFQAGAAVMVFVYSRLTDSTLLLWMGAIMGMFVNGMFGGYGALISEAYPTAARATAQNVLFNLGRGFGALGPLLIGSLAATYSFSTAIGLLASLYLCDILATVFLIPELKGKRLE
jgi:MFS family permease